MFQRPNGELVTPYNGDGTVWKEYVFPATKEYPKFRVTKLDHFRVTEEIPLDYVPSPYGLSFRYYDKKKEKWCAAVVMSNSTTDHDIVCDSVTSHLMFALGVPNFLMIHKFVSTYMYMNGTLFHQRNHERLGEIIRLAIQIKSNRAAEQDGHPSGVTAVDMQHMQQQRRAIRFEGFVSGNFGTLSSEIQQGFGTFGQVLETHSTRFDKSLKAQAVQYDTVMEKQGARFERTHKETVAMQKESQASFERVMTMALSRHAEGPQTAPRPMNRSSSYRAPKTPGRRYHREMTHEQSAMADVPYPRTTAKAVRPSAMLISESRSPSQRLERERAFQGAQMQGQRLFEDGNDVGVVAPTPMRQGLVLKAFPLTGRKKPCAKCRDTWEKFGEFCHHHKGLLQKLTYVAPNDVEE